MAQKDPQGCVVQGQRFCGTKNPQTPAGQNPKGRVVPGASLAPQQPPLFPDPSRLEFWGPVVPKGWVSLGRVQELSGDLTRMVGVQGGTSRSSALDLAASRIAPTAAVERLLATVERAVLERVGLAASGPAQGAHVVPQDGAHHLTLRRLQLV